MTNKYNIEFAEKALTVNINRLINQLWKLIPMREHEEDWKTHIETVLLEIVGLNEFLDKNSSLISLISKLEGLKAQETEFILYRKTVFETISLLREILK